MPGYLIKDTTKEERKQIVEESLGNISANCDGCMARLADMYQDYIDGKKEIREINMEFNARYVRGDMDKEEKEAVRCRGVKQHDKTDRNRRRRNSCKRRDHDYQSGIYDSDPEAD